MKFLITRKEKEWLERIAERGCSGVECACDDCPIDELTIEGVGELCEAEKGTASAILNNMVLVD